MGEKCAGSAGVASSNRDTLLIFFAPTSTLFGVFLVVASVHSLGHSSLFMTPLASLTRSQPSLPPALPTTPPHSPRTRAPPLFFFIFFPDLSKLSKRERNARGTLLRRRQLSRVLTDPMLTGISFVDAHGALRAGQMVGLHSLPGGVSYWSRFLPYSTSAWGCPWLYGPSDAGCHRLVFV